MSAVSPILKQTITELQSLPSVTSFALGGGTNLAFRYAHRISIDIDFISTVTVGIDGLLQIVKETENLYGKNQVTAILINKELDEQFSFLRMFITRGDTVIKVEFLQNMKCLFGQEEFDKIRLIHKTDIGLFKLMSASNRLAKKDIYDLDFITDEIPLQILINHLKEKTEKFNQPKDLTLFDLDNEKSPVENLELLLKFDETTSHKSNKPIHTHDRIDLVAGSKTWIEARISWRLKVRQLFSQLGKEFPKTIGFDI